MIASVDSPAGLEVDQLVQVLIVEELNRPHCLPPTDSVQRAERMARMVSCPWLHGLWWTLIAAICQRPGGRSSTWVHVAQTLVMGNQPSPDQMFHCLKPCCWLEGPIDSWALGDGLLWRLAREAAVLKPCYSPFQVASHCRPGECLWVISLAEGRELGEHRL